jgi:hypothetical protein
LAKKIDEVKYELKRFSKSNDRRYLKCIDIYMNNTAPALRTEPNQISYWLERLSKSEERSKREFFIFGLYLNNIEIGYAQIMYLKDKNIIIIDYMAIEKEYRKLGAFYQFVDLLYKYINTYMIGYDYIVTEVGYLSNGKEPSKESQILIRLLKSREMGVVKALYYQAQLFPHNKENPHNKESYMQAQLLMYSTNMPTEINKGAYLFIVETILYDHYMYWYEPFLESNDKALFEKNLKEILEKVKSNTSSLIEINSYINDFTNNAVQAGKEKPSFFINIGILLIFIILIVSSFIIIHVLSLLSIYVLLIIYLFSTILILLLTSIYIPEANKSLKTAIDLFKRFFGKVK